MLLDLRELTIQPEITLPLGKEEETCGAREDLAEIHQCRSKCESAGCYQMLERWVHRGGKGSRGGGQVEKQKEAEPKLRVELDPGSKIRPTGYG